MAKVFWSIPSKIRNLFLTAERLESKQIGAISQIHQALEDNERGKLSPSLEPTLLHQRLGTRIAPAEAAVSFSRIHSVTH
jgi:hypothetical protein